MPTKLTQADFIARAQGVHGDRYDYSETVFTSTKNKVKILCKMGHVFFASPDNHIRNKSGCPDCANKTPITTNEFIARAKSVHGDKYDYSQSVIKGVHAKLTIVCKEHGAFEQRAKDHYGEGKGCPHCAGRAKLTYESFLQKATVKHGDKYTYILPDNIRHTTRITINCPKHGDFIQKINNHLNGHECPKCQLGQVSKPELMVINHIKSLGFEVLENKKFSQRGKHGFRFDCLIPSLKIAIEFNGCYFHSIENKPEDYHVKKREHAESHGYRMITIWGDEWKVDKKGMDKWVSDLLNGKESIKTGKEILIDLDKEHLAPYLKQGYQIDSLAPIGRIREKRFICYNSGVAVLRKAA
jgi:hypothetical protein